MKTYNNEISIQRGETFTMSKILQNKDGSPYIISSELNNPFFLLTIASSSYAQKGRYIKNYWLDLKDFPRFLYTTPVNIRDYNSNGFDGITSLTDEVHEGKSIKYLFFKNSTYIEPYDFVYYDDVVGVRVYKYWDTVVNGWVDYECKLSQVFTFEDTNELTGQSYVYSIRLVTGQTMSDYLDDVCVECEECKEQCEGQSNEQKYIKLKEHGHTFPEGFNVERALATIDFSVPILTPTKLSVLNSL